MSQACRVVPGGARGTMAPPDFGRSVILISTKGGRLCPPNNAGTPGFSDLPTALCLQDFTFFYLDQLKLGDTAIVEKKQIQNF